MDGDERRVYEKPKGKTPLEMYNKFLVDEPPMCTELNNDIIGILGRLETQYQSPEANHEEIDKIFLEFLRSLSMAVN